MAAMLPPAIPSRVELIYLTGVLELLGALGVWIPGLMRLTGVCLILMLVGILPANIYSAINHVEFGGHVHRSDPHRGRGTKSRALVIRNCIY